MYLIKDNIRLKAKKDVILTHLYLKGKEYEIHLSEGVRELLFVLFEFGEVNSKQDFDKFIKICNQNTSLKSRDTVRNELSALTTKGVIINNGKYSKRISDNWLPDVNDDQIGLEYKILNTL